MEKIPMDKNIVSGEEKNSSDFIPPVFKGVKSSPDFKYEQDKDPKRIKIIKENLNQPKIAKLKYEGENINIEYIDIPAKNDSKKATVILPGFEASYKPYRSTAEQLALYNNDQRIVCLSQLSGKSSSINDYSLDKISKIDTDFFKKIGLEGYDLTVVGHSRSDVVAMELGRTNPDQVKNIVLANGILANKESSGGLAWDFTKHVAGKINSKRISGAFEGEGKEALVYMKQVYDFFKNLLSFKIKKTINQFQSMDDRKKINLDEVLSQLKSNILVLSSTQELTPYEDTREKISSKLPKDINSQLRIEVDGLHDEIVAHPEAFALKLKRWLESIEDIKDKQ